MFTNRFSSFFISILLLFFSLPVHAYAQEPMPKTEYVKAKVTKIVKDETVMLPTGQKNPRQVIEIEFLTGDKNGQTHTLTHGGDIVLSASQKLNPGDTVILSKIQSQQGSEQYAVTDKERLPTLLFIVLSFFLLTSLLAGRKGIGAVIGLLISVGVIVGFIVPQIIAGHDPLFISIVGSLFILVVTMFLAHGFTQKTTIAVSATVVSLLLTGAIAYLFVALTKLTGLGSEDIYTLQQGFPGINFQGLLLGSIIIGSLGVLDDVTTTQSATIFALSETDKKLTPRELFIKGMQVGREHITSVVNTLVLAYAGASIGVFIYLQLALTREAQPLWVILNSEVLTQEVVRSLAGSTGLILAVPLTTLLASLFSKYSFSVK